MGQEKDSLIVKQSCTNKQSKIRNLSTGRQVFHHLQESRTSAHLMVIWEDKHHYHERSPYSFFPQVFIAEYDMIWYEICLSSTEVSCPGCDPSQLLSHPQTTSWWNILRNRKPSKLCKHCSAIAKALAHYQYCLDHKSKTQHYTCCCEEN